MPRVGARHLIERVSYSIETIECLCGAIVTAPRDEAVRDRHEPLIAAWALHRAEGRVRGKPGRKVSAFVYEREPKPEVTETP